MKSLKTTKATDWPVQEPLLAKLMRACLFFIPSPNRENEKRFHLVKAWLIEFDDHGLPNREIGLDINDEPVLSADGEPHYGYWHDTNMQYSDFLGSDTEEIDNSQFDKAWKVHRIMPIVNVLRLAASDAEVQRSVFPDCVFPAHEVVLSLAESCILLSKLLKDGSVLQSQADAVERVHQETSNLSKHGEEVWSDESLRHHEAWANIRQLAKLALAELNAELLPPNPYWISYVESTADHEDLSLNL